MFKPALTALLLLACLPVQASTMAAALEGTSQRGAATFSYFGLAIYEARLFTRGGAPFDWNSEFGLELQYKRDLSRENLVEGTLREFRRTGGDLPLQRELSTCFRDVSTGDRFLGMTEGSDRISFWLNGQQTCTLSHPQIKYRFMAIFLGDNTRSASFTRRLRGQ